MKNTCTVKEANAEVDKLRVVLPILSGQTARLTPTEKYGSIFHLTIKNHVGLSLSEGVRVVPHRTLNALYEMRDDIDDNITILKSYLEKL